MAVFTDGSTIISLYENNDTVTIQLNEVDKITTINQLVFDYCLYDHDTSMEITPIPSDIFLMAKLKIGSKFYTNFPISLDVSQDYQFQIVIELILKNNYTIPLGQTILIKNVCIHGARDINAC